jgi:hypothetical protein
MEIQDALNIILLQPKKVRKNNHSRKAKKPEHVRRQNREKRRKAEQRYKKEQIEAAQIQKQLSLYKIQEELKKHEKLRRLTQTDSFAIEYKKTMKEYWQSQWWEPIETNSGYMMPVAIIAVKRYLERRKKLKEYSSICQYHSAKRQARLRDATPLWVDFDVIGRIYAERDRLNKQNLPDGPFHVDHVIPLQGRQVCGLHVPENLEIIPASLNFRKGNRFTP